MLIVALLAAVSSIAGYVLAAAGRRGWMSLGRTAYFASAVVVTAISGYFMWLILGNHFEFDYIYSNSSRSLPLAYKISVFWAGQQGSFLFWALCGAILGLFLMWKAREFEPWVMAFWSAMQGLFLALLLIDSPFKPTPTGMPITDGLGLRELLQNPWIVIHPPATFIGYAAMSVPAAFAVAALARGDLRSWCRRALPWTIFGWVTLGAGIILGAYWAYEVLGWGGYWGWDPVENSSLVPWLTGTALLHGMVAERYRGRFRRVNVVLALVTFMLVFYATFLTRSDALKDFSVHTFGDTRIGVPLLYFMGAFAVFSVALALWRWRGIESQPSFTTVISKDFAVFLGIVCLVAVAAFVLIGTSAPIIGKMASHVPVLKNVIPARITVGQAFYNQTNAPMALVVLALMALAPVLAWRSGKEGGQQGLGLLVAAVLVGLVVAALRLHLAVLAVAIAAAGLAGLITNAYTLARTARFGLRRLGGFAAHAGMGILFLGVILSASGGSPKTVTLVEGGKAIESGGYRFAYEGTKEFGERKEMLLIRVERDGRTIQATPTIEVTREDEILAKPYIVKSFGQDLYIAPKSIPAPERKVLARSSGPVPVQDFQLRFVQFVMPPGHGGGDVRIGARIEALLGGKKEIVTPFLVTRRVPSGSASAVVVPGMAATIRVDRIRADERIVEVTFTPKGDKPEALVLRRGEKVSTGGYQLLFREWLLPKEGHAPDFKVGVRIEITSGGRTAIVEPAYSPVQDGGTTAVSDPVPVPGAGAQVALSDVDLGGKQVLVTVTPTVKTAALDVSTKPFISLLWIGSVVALLGGCVAIWRRSTESSRAEEPAEV